MSGGMSDPARNIPPDLRREYGKSVLLESDLLPDPIAQFDRWFADATLAQIPDVNAMTLATADASAAPSSRIVLLKAFDPRGFVFFTNYNSRKGRDIAANPRASLCFYWHALERQVRIDGVVEKVSRQESEEYFRTRPIGSQIGAWVSQQGEVIPSREILDQRAQDLLKRFAGQPVPLPDFWGGYRVIPRTIEFWQGRPSRLHDRLQYVRSDTGWTIQRLSP